MTTPTPRTGHPYFMYDEVRAQPAAMRAALVADDAQRAHIARELAGTHQVTDAILGPNFLLPAFAGRGRVYLSGCGSAYHAALTGADWFRRITQGALDVQAVQAFEFIHYMRGGPRTHDAFLALSHSGIASATVEAARRAKDEDGMYTVALTAAPQSAVAQNSDETLITTTAPAVASTYTISHLTMLTVLADLARRTAEHLRAAREVALDLADDIAAFPDLAAAALGAEDQIRQIVAALPPINQVIYGGGGPNWATALEGALKTREAAYLPAAGFEMEEILHGPPASFDDHTAAVLIAPLGAARDRALDVLRALGQLGVTTIVFGSSGDTDLAALANHFVALPDCPEAFSVIPSTVLVQQTAYWLAMQRGANPDLIRRDQARWAAARQQYVR